MTPVPLDLPLRPTDAAELGNLIFEHAERKPLTEEVRNRIATRAAMLSGSSVVPWFGSLARDPIHPGSYYFAADAGHQPLLLHIALATAPTSSVFPKPLLIGRMRRVGGPEIIINAIPFGMSDEENIEKFATRVDTAFLPRPQGSRPAIGVDSALPEGFQLFRAICKRAGKNLAATAVAAGSSPRQAYYAALWAAIRTGWREGYTAGIDFAIDRGSLEGVKETIGQAPGFTRFGVDVSRLAGEHALEAAAQVHEWIRQTRAAHKLARPFDFEVCLGSVDPAAAGHALDWLKERGHAPQFLGTGTVHLEELAAIARQHQCLLSIRASPEHTPETWESIRRCTNGRFHYKVPGPLPDLAILAERLF